MSWIGFKCTVNKSESCRLLNKDCFCLQVLNRIFYRFNKKHKKQNSPTLRWVNLCWGFHCSFWHWIHLVDIFCSDLLTWFLLSLDVFQGLIETQEDELLRGGLTTRLPRRLWRVNGEENKNRSCQGLWRTPSHEQEGEYFLLPSS